MLKASLHKHKLIFKEPGGTSRGILTSKLSWYIKVWNAESPEIKGVGECSVLQGLSPDSCPELEDMLLWCCDNINEINDSYHNLLEQWPAVRFALETAFLDLKNGGAGNLFSTAFTENKAGIPINGLIWMGKPEEMKARIKEKLSSGFRCLKLKIGAIEFSDEYSILKELRTNFSPDELELRVDANGAFSMKDAPTILEKLAKLKIHSIEQPIKTGQWNQMQRLCEISPIPIALDEELIGINDAKQRSEMLSFIKPQYIILKPSFTGGFLSSGEWISIAESNNCKWWITSALEGNIGLNAIAQWTASLNVTMPQGLGTGMVFTNNIESRLKIENGALFYEKE